MVTDEFGPKFGIVPQIQWPVHDQYLIAASPGRGRDQHISFYAHADVPSDIYLTGIIPACGYVHTIELSTHTGILSLFLGKNHPHMDSIADLSQLDLRDGVYSYADYLTWQFDQAVELVKGKIFPMSAPSRRHQGISRELNGIFYNHFKGNACAFYAAPFDVRLYDKRKSAKANRDVLTVVQPDICVICDLDKLDDKGCLGSPDLVVEILSPGNSSKEMKLKKLLYEENGIREYWIIDPEHETAFQFHLTDTNRYSPATIYVSDEVLNCVIFPGLTVPLTDVFQSF